MKNIVIFFDEKAGAPTAKRMVATLFNNMPNEMSNEYTFFCPSTAHEWSFGDEDAKVDTLIRWGTSAPIPESSLRAFEGCREINKPDGIKIATSKILSFDKFSESGIPCPKFWRRSDITREASRGVMAANLFPVLARKNTGSKEYEATWILRSITELNDFLRTQSQSPTLVFSQYISKEKEQRFHVVNGQVVTVSQRVARNTTEMTPEIFRYVWGLGRHWGMIHDVESSDAHKEIAVRAVASLGLDFGAVDMMIKDDGSPYVLEVNTAPSLLQETRLAYAPKLIEMLA